MRTPMEQRLLRLDSRTLMYSWCGSWCPWCLGGFVFVTAPIDNVRVPVAVGEDGLEAVELAESGGLLARPSPVGLAVGAYFAVEQRVGAAAAFDLDVPFEEPHADIARDGLLAAADQGLDVAHHGVEIEALVEHVAVYVRQMVFPELLLFGEHELLQLLVGGDGDEGG